MQGANNDTVSDGNNSTAPDAIKQNRSRFLQDSKRRKNRPPFLRPAVSIKDIKIPSLVSIVGNPNIYLKRDCYRMLLFRGTPQDFR